MAAAAVVAVAAAVAAAAAAAAVAKVGFLGEVVARSRLHGDRYFRFTRASLVRVRRRISPLSY
jgi:hypothetical protein